MCKFLATSSLSWWPGDKLYKERNKNGEEEKHEKESTKEKNGKRDLSPPQTDPLNKRHVGAGQEDKQGKGMHGYLECHIIITKTIYLISSGLWLFFFYE